MMASQKNYLRYIYVEVLTFSTVNKYTKPTEHVDIIRRTSQGFLQLVPWKHESVERVLSGHQLGNPSDVL